jgi:hypothetical protein
MKLWALAALLGVASSVASAQTSEADSGTAKAFAGSDLKRIVLNDQNFGYWAGDNKQWPKLKDKTTVVFVCWESAQIVTSPEAGWVKAAIKGSWQDNSRLIFRGWEACAPKSSGIRIQVVDAGPRTLGLGTDLDGKSNGMALNFSFVNWGSNCATTRQACIESIAIHEFGHAIGFAHEQNEPDAPGECHKLAQGSNGVIPLTPYDPDSVMNYCNPRYNNNGMLSPRDIDSVQQKYEKPS